MNTYNANPGYEMDLQLLTHFNQHLDSLFGVGDAANLLI